MSRKVINVVKSYHSVSSLQYDMGGEPTSSQTSDIPISISNFIETDEITFNAAGADCKVTKVAKIPIEDKIVLFYSGYFQSATAINLIIEFNSNNEIERAFLQQVSLIS